MAWTPDPSMIITASEKVEEARKGMSATGAQFRLKLHADGKMLGFTTWLALQPPPTQIHFEYRDPLLRTDPLVIAALAAQGYNVEQMDAFFQAATKL